MDNEEFAKETLRQMQEQTEMYGQLIHSQIEVKDAQLDKLHEELSYYKQEQADRILVGIMKELVTVRKGMRRLIKSESWDSLTADELRKEYQYVYEDMTDLLERQEIDEYVTGSGEDFNGQIHIVFQTELTEDETKDKKIKKSVMEGYSRRGRILVPEKVVVYQYKKGEK